MYCSLDRKASISFSDMLDDRAFLVLDSNSFSRTYESLFSYTASQTAP